MFVRYFVELPYPVATIEPVFTSAPDRWMSALARTADERGERLLTEVGLGSKNGDLPLIGKRVGVTVGAPVRTAQRTWLPIAWQAAGPSALFPVLDAELEIAPLGRQQTQLALSGSYTPPLGPVGRAIDRALLHRVAEATVKDFVDRVARALVGLSTEPSSASKQD
jgi:hypothetical protein